MSESSIDRRRFLSRAAGLAGAALALPSLLPAKPASAGRLTIVHTNDIHSWLEPMDAGEYAGLGGAPARAAAIAKLRREFPNLLLLDSGDMMQGTAYFNIFRGEAELVAMSAQEYTAGTLGNHDFDAGAERLSEVIAKHAKFPLLNCNYGFAGTAMEGRTKESIVREVGGMRVGLLGLGIRLDGLVGKELWEGIEYRDPVEHARRVARSLRHDESCDVVIALSHINLYGRGDEGSTSKFPGDRDLAREIPEIDVVVGGHNHVRLEVPERIERAGSPSPCIVAQTGWAGTHLGVYHVDVFERGKHELAAAGMLAARAVA